VSGQLSGTEYVAAYAAVQQRIAAVVTAGDCDRPVPACPGWTVHDVVAHLAGLCQDWVDDRRFGYASEEWTADQVSRFAGRPCAEILEAWAVAMGPFRELRELMNGFPAGRWAFGDAVVHEADVRGALGAGRVPDGDVGRVLQLFVGRWQNETMVAAGLPTLEIRSPEGPVWLTGAGGGAPAHGSVGVPTYDLFRALAGRRSAVQVRAWDWSIDPEPFVAAGLPYPFRWAAEDLTD
jgi:uncharacterized protein (TIGR03083 family)